MRVLVAGGAGFLGSHLVDRLWMDGHHVIVMDNFVTGLRSNLATAFQRGERIDLIQRDVTHPVPKLPVDWIYNLACPASPPHYQKDPVRTLDTSFNGTWELLKLAKTTRARFLQASTSEVYGDPKVHPQTEDYWGHVNPIGARACYDEGKRAAEALIAAYQDTTRVDARIVRIFNTYGPRMRADDGRAVSNFVVQALKGKPLTVYGKGTQTRSFCYVDDLVEGLVRMMEKEHPSTAQPINLGNPAEHTLNELAMIINRMVGNTAGVSYKALPMDDPTRRCPSIRWASAFLSWRPKITLEEGLTRTIAWFRKTMGG